MEYPKKTFKNLTIYGIDIIVGLTQPKDRGWLYERLKPYGMGRSKAFTRFYRGGTGRGFDTWEMWGVRQCIRRFEQEHHLKPTPEQDYPKFYEQLDVKGLRTDFLRYMQRLGLSRNTALRRFYRDFQFDPWEMDGMIDVIAKVTVIEPQGVA